jgi:electron transport complex protein RnfD
MATTYLTSHPHFSAGLTTKRIMLTVIASLLPAAICGVVVFGAGAAVTIVVSVAACVFFEWAFRKIAHLPPRVNDCSAAVTGLLLALVCPADIPVWMLLIGDLFAIVVAKEFFGGIGANVFNPALSGRAVLLLSFAPKVGPSQWLLPISERTVDAITGATALGGIYGAEGAIDAISSASIKLSNYLPFLTGTRGGCIGETGALWILIGAVILLATKTIDWRAPCAMIVTTVVLSALGGADPLMALLSGGLLFGAVFMATDYTTAPVTKGGRLVFGFGCGLITFLIRKFGGYPEGVMFSILIMNVFVPFLNNIIPHKYGYVKPAAKSAGGK